MEKEKLELLKIGDLQFFAEDPKPESEEEPTEEPKGEETEEPEDKKKKEGEEKTFTQKELDRIVEERIRRAEKDKEEAIEEAKKLAKMNEQEKKDYQLEKLKEENRQLKLKQTRAELGKEALSMLSENGIVANDEILSFVVKDDADGTKKAVKAFSDLVDKVSEERMKEKLKGKAPSRPSGKNRFTTKEDIMSIKDSEKRLSAIQQNRHLFQ